MYRFGYLVIKLNAYGFLCAARNLSVTAIFFNNIYLVNNQYYSQCDIYNTVDYETYSTYNVMTEYTHSTPSCAYFLLKKRDIICCKII